jgi:hypothetical protein
MNIRTVSYGTRSFREIGSLAESDMLGMYGTGDLQPEKRLMFAILLDAVDCFQEHAKDDRLFKETEEWIFEDDHEWPFSFINICQALDMDPEYLRKGLLNSRPRVILGANTRRLSERCFSKAARRSTFAVVSQIVRRSIIGLSRSAESRRDKRRLRGQEDFEHPSRRTKFQ